MDEISIQKEILVPPQHVQNYSKEVKTLNTILVLSLFIGIALGQAAQSRPRRFPQNQNQMMMYQVQPGDHLAEILRSMGLEPLWGPEGSVQRTIEINNLKSPNQLPPGIWIKIPADQPADMSNYEMDHGVVRKKPSTVDVHCPDGSVQSAQVYMVPAKPGRPAKVVILNSGKAVCSETSMKAVPVPPPAVSNPPVATDLPPQDPDAIDDLDVQLKTAQPTPVAEKPNEAAKTDPAEEKKPEEVAKAASEAPLVEEKKQPVEDYFDENKTAWGWQLAPQIGYGSNRFEVDSTHFTMNKGFNYGARLEGSWGTRKDQVLFGANYLSASLVNSGVSTDKSTVTMTSYGLGYRHNSWSYRAGMLKNSIKNTVGTNSVNFNGSGTYFSIAHDWKIALNWTFGYELRYATASYSSSSNSSLQSDLKGAQIESILGFEYRWGANK